VGVFQFAPPSDDEQPLASMRGSHVGSAQIEPDRIIPRLGKASENGVQPPSSERCDVLHDDDAGSKVAHDAGELEPETRALTREASALPCVRHVLTGEAATEDIDAGRVGSDGSHVVVSTSARPVSGEDAATPRVCLALPER
jgi:hypothetical protein